MKILGLQIGRAPVIEQTTEPAKKHRMRNSSRNYKSAKQNDLTYGWSTTPVSINETIRMQLRSLRARSRDVVKNNDYAKRYIGLLCQNVIGANGIVLQARSVGADGKLDKVANAAIEKFWRKWGKRCTLDGVSSWHDVCKLFISTIAEDGEILIRKYRGRGVMNFSLQLLDPEMLDIDYFAELKGGRRIRMGIEFSAESVAIAYHLLTVSGANGSYVFSGRNYVRVPADEIMHEFVREKVGQLRGIPWFATPALRLRMLDGFEDAALVNARYGASKMATIETEAGAAPYTGDDVPDDEDDGEVLQEIEAGIVEELPVGKKLVAFDPTYPSNEFASFVQQMNRGAAAGLNMAYHTFANDLSGVNYSAGVLGEQENRLSWCMLQTFTVDRLCSVVFEEWLSIQLATGGIAVPTKTGVPKPLRAAMFDKYAEVEWQPMRWAAIDPVKTMRGYEIGINLGLYSKSQVIRELGRNPDDVQQEIENEYDFYDKFGVNTAPADGKTEKPDEESGDEKED